MYSLLVKFVSKIKNRLNPYGFSRVRKGLGSGIYWSNRVSDLRYVAGDYEPELSSWLVDRIKQGKSFVDIGANAGYFSLVAEKYLTNTEQKIVAVEPFPDNVRLIEGHISKNKTKHVHIVQAAVSDKNGEVSFSDSGNPSANTYVSESSLHKNFPKIKVKAVSLDSLAEELGLKNFVLKIDVEGAELDVLKGAKDVLGSVKPEIVLATHECHVPGMEEACLEFLKGYGYQCTAFSESKSVDGQRDYLCSPK